MRFSTSLLIAVAVTGVAAQPQLMNAQPRVTSMNMNNEVEIDMDMEEGMVYTMGMEEGNEMAKHSENSGFDSAHLCSLPEFAPYCVNGVLPGAGVARPMTNWGYPNMGLSGRYAIGAGLPANNWNTAWTGATVPRTALPANWNTALPANWNTVLPAGQHTGFDSEHLCSLPEFESYCVDGVLPGAGVARPMTNWGFGNRLVGTTVPRVGTTVPRVATTLPANWNTAWTGATALPANWNTALPATGATALPANWNTAAWTGVPATTAAWTGATALPATAAWTGATTAALPANWNTAWTGATALPANWAGASSVYNPVRTVGSAGVMGYPTFGTVGAAGVMGYPSVAAGTFRG